MIIGYQNGNVNCQKPKNISRLQINFQKEKAAKAAFWF